MSLTQKKILMGCSGSVATIRLPTLIQKTKTIFPDSEIQLVTTQSAAHFFDKDQLSVRIYSDQCEWNQWKKMGDDVLHIELGKWADILIVAPLSANSLAKVASGICDNLLLCTIRAWDKHKPLLFAPAMNTRMLEHPITQPQIDKLVSWGYHFIPTVKKALACGETGYGAMAEVDTIVKCIQDHLCKTAQLDN